MTETPQAVVLESRQPSDYQQQLAKSLDPETDLIVTPIPYVFSEPTHAAAEAAPDRKFLMMEARSERPLDNLRVEQYAVDQAAFLAGYAAASVTRSGKVGTLGGVNMASVILFTHGFAHGIAYYNEQRMPRLSCRVGTWRSG